MKFASEGIITAALERFLKRAWICRFPNVVGGRATHGAIFDFLQKLRAHPAQLEELGDGAQEKPYLHVGELVDARPFVCQQNPCPFDRYNVGPQTGAATDPVIYE